jgi:hypothetical protein
MIVSFSVSNFRSFSSEETLSLVASNRLVAHPEHAVPIPDSTEKVLRAAVLYGANGAGKSNLFKALQYLKKVALGTGEKSLQPLIFSLSRTIASIGSDSKWMISGSLKNGWRR